MSGETIKIKLTKSPIGYNKKQKAVLIGMGLKKMNQIVSLKKTAPTLGMIRKVEHLVTIIDEA